MKENKIDLSSFLEKAIFFYSYLYSAQSCKELNYENTFMWHNEYNNMVKFWSDQHEIYESVYVSLVILCLLKSIVFSFNFAKYFSLDKIWPSIFTLSIYTWCEKASGAYVGSVGR